MDEIPEQPKKTAGDLAHAVVRAAVSAVPVVGGPAVEMLGLVFGPPLEKRRQEWLKELAAAVGELQEKVTGITPEKLSEDPAFVTTAMRASEIAVRTHQQEKLDALRNAIVNSKLPGAPEETLQDMFLHYVDAFTPLHMRILSFFHDPPGWMQGHGVLRPNLYLGSPAGLLEVSMLELAGRRDFYDRLMDDLVQRGLMTGGGMHTSMTEQGFYASRTTPLGEEFLEFISKR